MGEKMRVWPAIAIAICLAACGPASPPSKGLGKEAAPPTGAAPTAPTKGQVVTPLSANDDPLTPFRGNIKARGTEPFWVITVSPADGKAVLRSPDNEQGQTFTISAPRAATSGVVLIPAGQLTLALRDQSCSDGMSDMRYPWSVTVTVGGDRLLRGCAFPRWADDLVNLIGAIDACLIELKDPLAPVVWGARTREGATIRLQQRETIRDCNVTPSGTAILGKGMPDAEGQRLPSQGYPIFHRGPQPNPGGQCFQADIARGAKNEDLGWLTDADGC